MLGAGRKFFLDSHPHQSATESLPSSYPAFRSQSSANTFQGMGTTCKTLG